FAFTVPYGLWMVCWLAPGTACDDQEPLWSICTIAPRGLLGSRAVPLAGSPDIPARRRLSTELATQVCALPGRSAVALMVASLDALAPDGAVRLAAWKESVCSC